ncbi:MAG: HAMP domain-containing sensor histidine kinase [Bacteroidota bacterium]
MNKPRLIFIFLSVYIVAAFGWWAFAHIRSSEEINALTVKNAKLEVEKDEILCYKATVEMGEELKEDAFIDTTQMQGYFKKAFPRLELVFIDTITPFNGYMIRPKESAYIKLEKEVSIAAKLLTKKKWMYVTEGIVMIVLLIWGIMWVYKTFEKSILLNKQQNNFLLAVTHELKTPLASVKLYLETLLKHDLERDKQKTIMTNSINDVNRLRYLVDNLLLSAQLETKQYEPVFKEMNLSEFLNAVIDKYATPRNLKNRIIKNIEQEVYINGDEFALESVVINLISNAEKYSDENITVLLKSDSKHVLFSVSDLGIGIGDVDKQRLFGKFFRVGDEQTRKSKGTGLGLFIVKNLLRLHHATIEVKNNQPKGTNFEVTFNV